MKYCIGYNFFINFHKVKYLNKSNNNCMCKELFKENEILRKIKNFNTDITDIPIYNYYNKNNYIIIHGNVISIKNKKILLIGKSKVGKSDFSYYAVKKNKLFYFVNDDVTFIKKENMKVCPCSCRPFLKRKKSGKYLNTRKIFKGKIDSLLGEITCILYLYNDDSNKPDHLTCILESLWTPSVDNVKKLISLPFYYFKLKNYNYNILIKFIESIVCLNENKY